MGEQFWRNLRYALRSLRKSPGFTAVALLSLAVGIGANSAIFTLTNALLLRDLPVRQPERLVELSLVRQGRKIPFSLAMYREIQRGQRVFSEVMAWSVGDSMNVETRGTLSTAMVAGVSRNYYGELGTVPLLGRLLAPHDMNPEMTSAAQVAVLGYDFWQRRFGGAPDVVGKQIRIEGQPFTIVGVTRKWFAGMNVGELPEVTIPIAAEQIVRGGDSIDLQDRAILWLSITGRLKEGVNIQQARAQLQSIWHDVLLATVSTQTPGIRRDTFLSMGLDISPAAKGIAKDLRAQFTRPLYLLLGMVGLILLAACLNLANLMLARSAAHRQEISVRLALGASRSSVAGQVLAEALVLSLSGALLGLLFAYWGSRMLVVLMTQDYLTPVLFDLRPDGRVLVVTICTAGVTGIFFGLAPAWRSCREDPASALQRDSRTLTARSGWMGKTLIIAQVSLSLVLVLGAALFVQSLRRLRSVDGGFDKERVLDVTLNPVPGGHRDLDMNAYRKALLERISHTSGVHSASFSTSSIPIQDAWKEETAVSGAPANTGIMAGHVLISPEFLHTLGIRLMRGRDFNWTDDEHHAPVAILSNSLARQLFPDGDAIGMRIRVSIMPNFQSLEVVGIAADARLFDLRDAAAPVVYTSCVQGPNWTQFGHLFLRTGGDPERVREAVGDEIQSLGHEYALRTKTLAEFIDAALLNERMTATLSSCFGVIALLLASIGLYGLMSYSVSRRTREIGVRMALGAQRRDVLGIVLRETLALAAGGIALGITCSLLAGRLIGGMLFRVSWSDPATIGGVSLLLLGVALAAGYVPALRAWAIDPITALRTE